MKSRLLFAGCIWLLVAFGRGLIASQPPLTIANTGGEITISWPVSAGNWVLEGTPVLSPAASWSGVVPKFDQIVGSIRQVGILASDVNRFFRLRRLDAGEPGLTGRWQLDEGSGQVAQDASGVGTSLFIEDGTWTSGRIGTGSLRFNGGMGAGASRSWVSNSNYQVLPGPGQPFSVSFWFSPDALAPGARGLAGTDANGSNGWHLALSNAGPGTNYLVFAGAGSSATLSVTGRTLLLPGQWYKLTATYDGLAGNVYLDGVRLATGVGTIPVHNGPLYFGGGVGGYSSFLGRMDDVRTLKVCLPDERISLTGEWLFNESMGTFSADSSGNEQHGTLSDSAARVQGYQAGGVDLNSCQIVIPNEDQTVLPPSGRPFSISLRLRPGALSPGRFGLMHHGLDGINGWQMAVAIGESGQADLQLNSTNTGGTLDLTVPISFAVGVWAKLDVTFNGGIATVYCNGRKVRAGSGAIRASRSPIVIGSVPGLGTLPCSVDELRIRCREMGESEIGPVAPVMWETALRNTVTNFVLRGSGPPGRLLTYTIVPTIDPTNGSVAMAAGSAVATYSAGARKGPDAFTYTVSDGEFTTAPSIVRVSVVEPHWLSPSGGSAPLRDGRSVSTAWAAGNARSLDAIWKTNAYYDCFYYAPGEYQTTGWKSHQRSTANSGCKHIGSGSEGPDKTTIKLVDIWERFNEELIFGSFQLGQMIDDFELHRMVLDCNAANLPKYVTGEPVWIRVPLNSAGRVESVTLRWGNGSVPWNPGHRIGRAAEFSVRALRLGAITFLTNCTSVGQVDIVAVGAEADELLLQLEKRAPGVDYYGLQECEVAGATASLPSATVPGAGDSRLDVAHAISFAMDGDLSTSWASGLEEQARITVPMAPGTAVNRVRLSWNCRTLLNSGRLGPAATYSIQARDESTGDYHDVPFVRSTREVDGIETIGFGTVSSPVTITSDRLAIVLTSREPSVNFYSLREVALWDGPAPVLIRQPTSLNNLVNADFPIAQAVDGKIDTQWVSNTQGGVSAVTVCGSNFKFNDLLVVGFGTKAGRECFPMAIGPQYAVDPPFSGNVLVENCRFADPATNNKDGLTVLSVRGTPAVSLTNAVIRRCRVTGMRPYFPLYSQAMSSIHIEDSYVSECSRAVYFEPERAVLDNYGPVLIRSNQFINVDAGVFLSFHSDAKFDSLTCLDNEIVLSGNVPSQWGIAACDLCLGRQSGSISNLTALNNIIRYADWGVRPAGSDGGLYYSDIRHAVFANNLIVLRPSDTLEVRGCPLGASPPNPPIEDCDHYDSGPPGPSIPIPCLDELLPGYRRVWLNNRNLSGGLLQVRTYDNGVYRPATHQQWSE